MTYAIVIEQTPTGYSGIRSGSAWVRRFRRFV